VLRARYSESGRMLLLEKSKSYFKWRRRALSLRCSKVARTLKPSRELVAKR